MTNPTKPQPLRRGIFKQPFRLWKASGAVCELSFTDAYGDLLRVKHSHAAGLLARIDSSFEAGGFIRPRGNFNLWTSMNTPTFAGYSAHNPEESLATWRFSARCAAIRGSDQALGDFSASARHKEQKQITLIAKWQGIVSDCKSMTPRGQHRTGSLEELLDVRIDK